MKRVHVDPAEAVQAHLDLGAKVSVGMHFGSFQLTEEAIDQPLSDLAEARRAKGLSDAEFIALKEGRTTIFEL